MDRTSIGAIDKDVTVFYRYQSISTGVAIPRINANILWVRGFEWTIPARMPIRVMTKIPMIITVAGYHINYQIL